LARAGGWRGVTRRRRPASGVVPAASALERARAQHQRGNLAEAERLYEQVLARHPEHAAALHAFGLLRLRQGNAGDAGVLLRRAVVCDPASADAHNDLAVALHSLELLDEAVASYRAAITLKPEFGRAHDNLTRALLALGRPAEAAEQYRHVVALEPNAAEAHNNLGVMLGAAGALDAACASYATAAALKPDFLDAHNNLGIALTGLGHFEAALASYERALAIDPGFVEALSNRGNVLSSLGRHDDAIASLDAALAIDPRHAAAWSNKAHALMELKREGDAVDCLRHALAIDPSRVEAYRNLSSALQILGRADEARQAIEAALALAPQRIELYHLLIDRKRFTDPNDPHLAAMQALAGDIGAYGPADQANLHFSLAKAYEDLGEPARAFRHLRDANALKRGEVAYDEAETLRGLARIADAFTPALFERWRGAGEPSAVPVFIVGMPRSGTTLIEQILAGHGHVFAGGELEDFPRALLRVTAPDELLGGAPLALPADVARLSRDQLRALGVDYLAALSALAPAAPRVTDKLPLNFLHAGLIHLALPGARIVHVQRDPIDTCLSCFTKNFVGDQPYSYELGELGRYYRAYETLMAHWRRVLPAGVLLDVRYEDVIDDLEGQARRLIAHCGLAWDEGCLAFHRIERPVRTASASQVRQPLYRSAVGRWRAYGALLAPLLAALGVDDAAGAPAP
jgi:tetratricopeptide (TPR) repeat protein